MTKGFKKYFCYKLSKCRRSMIFFAILNILGVLLPSVLMNFSYSDMLRSIEELEGFSIGILNSYDFSLISLSLVFAAAAVSIIVITVTMINSMKLYNNRACVDTLGSLPISYRERFFGDLLSGIFSNFISFVPCFLISLIFLGGMRDPKYAAIERYYVYDYLRIPRMIIGLFLMTMLIYLGVYAVTMFVSSCCGKKGSAVLYSLIAMAALPGIFIVYGNEMLSRVIGMDAYFELMKNIGMLPPFGPAVSVLMANSYDTYLPLDPKYFMLNENPLHLVIFLIITAAFIAGAYFIGKRRRAENVGEGFVFKSAYHVLTMTFMVLLIGASFVGYSNFMEGPGVPWVLLFTFLVYAALEISQNYKKDKGIKGFKGFWKSLVRYAAVFGACLGFFAIVKSTNSFNMYKFLPSAASVKEIRLSGEYFYNTRRSTEKQYVLDTKAAVSDILSEHESLLNSNGVETGEELKIVYVLNNGQEIMRNYSVTSKENDVVKMFSDAARNLPDFDYGYLGIIDKPNLTDYSFSFFKNGHSRKYIREEKLSELAEILRNDIKTNYSLSGLNHYYGSFMITEKNQKHDYENDIYVLPSYTATIEFIENPENYTTEEIKSEMEKYVIIYGSEDVSIRVYVSTEDTSPAAKELLSYIKPRDNDFDARKNVRVTGMYSENYYRIDPAHEERAKDLMLEIFLDKH